MTKRQKRLHRLPPEEIPSKLPPAEESPKAQESVPAEPAPDAEETSDAGASSGMEFYFPPLKNDGGEGFTPLPQRDAPREPIQLPGPGAPKRRKRPNRPVITRPDVSELGQRFENMAYRAAPTFDFFLFSLIAGLILGVGYLFDAPAVLLVGLIIIPVLAPWVGAVLATVTGESAFFRQTIGGFTTALVMVFITGLLAGFISRILGTLSATQALLHAQLSIFDLLLVGGGTVALTIAFVQAEEKPLFLTSLLVAYEIYLPVSAIGFGLGSGVENIWPQALVVLAAHLAVSAVLALLVFYYMGFRPLDVTGYLMPGAIALGSLAVVAFALAWGGSVRIFQPVGTPVGPKTTPATLVLQPTFTSSPQPTPTETKLVLTPTITETSGPTAIPTPVYGRVGKRGAYLMDEPGGTAITTLDQGYLVEFLPDSPSSLEGTTWVRVKVKTTTRDMVGWVRLDFVVTATPGPADAVTATTTPTITMTATIGPTETQTATMTPTVTYEPTGSYSVVNISKFEAALNVRTAAGIANPLAGTLPYTATDIARLGPPEIVGSAEWWQIVKTGGATGWVNASYLTEYIPSATFCGDSAVKTLLTDLGTAIKETNGTALAALVSPKHGLDIRLVSNNTPVNYPTTDAATVFTSNAVQNWGPALGSDATKVSGTFADVMQPKLLEVYQSNYESTCNTAGKIVSPANISWPSAYATVNYYTLYKPASGETDKWRAFMVGVEYIEGKPYVFALVNFEPAP